MGTITVLRPENGALTEYYKWVDAANHGDTLIYWTGDLQFDRQTEANADLIDSIANRVLVGSTVGEVILTQKRVAPYQYEYRATRIRDQEEKAFHDRVRSSNFI